MNKSLPKGWVETEFANVISVMTNGGNFKQEDRRNKGYYPISRIETIWNEEIDLGRVKYAKVTDGDFEKYSLKIGDILFSHINSDKHLGKTALYKTDVQLIHGINLLLLRSESKVLPNYVNYYLRNYRFKGGFLEIAQRSVNQSSINQKKLSSIPFPLPPLPEQERIVAKLDKLFAQHEMIKKALDRIPQLLKAFRQQVLTQAVTGKLTEQWREGKELDEWKTPTLKEVCFSFKYGSSSKSEEVGKVAVLRMGNLQNGRLDLSDLKYSNSKAEIEKYTLLPGDVLFNRTNSPELVGKTSIYKGEIPAIYAGYLIKIENNRDILDSDYLNFYMNTPQVKVWCNEVKSDGVSQSNINAKKLAELEISLPPLQEQQEIVRRVECLFAKADTIEARYLTLKAKIDSLPQAILHKAFKGELVPQLPTDGDAKDLLAEIMALKKETRGRKK